MDEDTIQEIPEYSAKSEFSKARVIEQALMSCTTARAVEMKEGYFNTKFTKEGAPINIWVPDTREKFFGSVHALLSLLSPEIARDKTAKQEVEIFDEECENIKSKYIYEELQIYSDKGILKYTKTGNKFMPPIDSKVVIKIFDRKMQREVYEEVIGGWNDKVNTYKNELVEVYDWLVGRLNDAVDRTNYFKPGAMF